MILWLCSISLLFLVSLLWHRRQRTRGWPLNSFLFDPRVRHTDLTLSIYAARRPKPYEPIANDVCTPYFPFVLMLMKLDAVWWLRIVYVALVGALTYCWGWTAAVVFLMSYPALFADDRGSLDHVIAAWSGLSVAVLLTGHPVVAGIMLAAVVAMKGYPAALGLLWWGHWWGMAAMIATTLVLFILPAMTFEGGLRESLAGLRRGNQNFYRFGLLAEKGPPFCTSHYCCDVFSALRLLQWWRGREFNGAKWIGPCIALATVWASGLAWIAWTSPQLWVKLLALGLVQVVWPHVANDYKLMVLAPGIVLWLHAGAPGLLLGACLVLLWAPKHFWFPRPSVTAASVSCVINPVLLMVATVALWTGR